MGSWWFFKEKYVAYSRFLSCSCRWCKTGIKDNIINKCINSSTVGRLMRWELKPKVNKSVHTNNNHNPIHNRPCNQPPLNKRRKTN